jgi:hypothetical protein
MVNSIARDVLQTCDLNELEEICRESNIDISQFSVADLEMRKQEMLEALMATYPPEHERKYHRQIMRIVETRDSEGRVDEEEVNGLFLKLLTNLDVEEISKISLLESLNSAEKIQHLASSVWYIPPLTLLIAICF